MNKLRTIRASALSASITALFVVAITIFAEVNAPLKDWLKGISGHHWTTKSIFSVVLYIAVLFIFYSIFKANDSEKTKKALNIAIWSSILGALLIFLFYTGHHIGLY